MKNIWGYSNFYKKAYRTMINAVITGIGGYVPEDILTNEDLSKIVDTTDEWIMSRVGVRERRILKDGKAMSYMAVKAVNNLIAKTGIDPDTVEGIICATSTGDYPFPPTSTIIAYQTGCKNAFAFDLQAACSGFIYLLETVANYIRSGRYKRIIVVAGDKMTSITNYTDRTTCPLFGDGCGAILVEPTSEKTGIQDSILRSDGSGLPFLQMKAGGTACRPSHKTVDNQEHTVYQEGKIVFKRAVVEMADVAAEIVARNGLKKENIDWIVPHQANLRIIDAAAKRLEVPVEKVMINIQKYGNTSAGSIPLCLWEWESKLKKGDNLILAAFGAGFTWGATYLKWGYDGSDT
jgi:3-oxoacyl-[acyl-carrier-protein] synthase-3